MNKFLLAAIPLALTLTANAQQRNVLTEKDYERAERLMNYNTEQFVDHGSVRPNWLPDDRFWYRILTPTGSEFILVDPAKKNASNCF